MENPPGPGSNFSGSGGQMRWGYEKADLRFSCSTGREARGDGVGVERC